VKEGPASPAGVDLSIGAQAERMSAQADSLPAGGRRAAARLQCPGHGAGAGPRKGRTTCSTPGLVPGPVGPAAGRSRGSAAAGLAAELKADLTRQGICTMHANDKLGRCTSDFLAILQECGAGGMVGSMARRLRPDAEGVMILKMRHSAGFATA
jgi:hypothetical protein